MKCKDCLYYWIYQAIKNYTMSLGYSDALHCITCSRFGPPKDNFRPNTKENNKEPK